MDIELTSEQQAFINTQLSAGSYTSPSDVIEAGFLALARLENMKLELNEKIEAAENEASQGLGIPGDQWYRDAMKKWGDVSE